MRIEVGEEGGRVRIVREEGGVQGGSREIE
jgi:hypothetical protein